MGEGGMTGQAGDTAAREYELVNAYDGLVKGAVYEVMQGIDMCRCGKCYLDVCAMVFNKKYTRWVTTHKGELYAKLGTTSTRERAELMVTIMEAVNMVKASPKHDG